MDEHLPDFCPRYHRAVELIGKRWTGSIIRPLLNGPHRFNALLGTVPGISDRLLTERLRELEAEGLVTRNVLPGPPVGVEYALTEKALELQPVVNAIASWAERWVNQEPSTQAG
ncbi:MAG: winged helix-turn-helix transcriptional regulator [Candidatus Dormibacteria bacterium]